MPEALALHLAILRASPLAIVAVDPQQIVTLWNPAAEKLFGWQETEVLGRECPPFVPDDRRQELLVVGGADIRDSL